MPRASRKIIKNTLGVINSWGGKIKVAGEIIFHAGSTPPSGFLAANGQLVSRTTYANLFAAIGTIHGAGDGSTTFAVPDLRGEFIRGVDGGRGIDTGRALGSAQAGSVSTALGVYRLNSTSAILVGPNVNTMADAEGTSIAQGDPIGVLGSGQYYSASLTPQGGSITYKASVDRPRNVALLPCIQF